MTWNYRLCVLEEEEPRELRNEVEQPLKFHRHHHSCFIFKQSIIYPIPIWSRDWTQYLRDFIATRHKNSFANY